MEGSAFWGVLLVISARPNNVFYFFLILEDYSIFVEQIKLAQDCEVSIEEVNPFFSFKRQRWGSLVAFVYHVDLREIARKKTSCKVQRAF